MTLKIFECLSIYNSLNSIKKENSLSFSTAWIIDDILKELQTHVERAQTEQNSLYKKYGDKVEGKDGVYEIREAEKGQFLDEFNKVNLFEVEVNIKKIAFDDLQKEEIKVSKNVDVSIMRLIIEN